MDKDPLKKGESRPGKLRNIVLSAINDQLDIQSSNQTKTERTISQLKSILAEGTIISEREASPTR